MSAGGRKETVPHVYAPTTSVSFSSATDRLPVGTLHTACSTLVAQKSLQIISLLGPSETTILCQQYNDCGGCPTITAITDKEETSWTFAYLVTSL